MSIVEKSLNKPFGKLTVKRFVEYKATPKGAKTPIVECECECGRMKIASLWDIRSGKTKTCGVSHPQYEDRSLPAIHHLYNHAYKSRAVAKGLEFTLSEERFRELTQQSCHYCGVPPNGKYTVRNRKSHEVVSEYTYNGLDRKNPEIGYTEENVVPCCGVCNHAKHTMTYEEFTTWIVSVTRHWKPG